MLRRITTLVLLTTLFSTPISIRSALSDNIKQTTRIAQAKMCPENVGGSYINSCGSCTVDRNCNMSCECDGQKTSVSLIACPQRDDGIKHFCNHQGKLRCGEGC